MGSLLPFAAAAAAAAAAFSCATVNARLDGARVNIDGTPGPGNRFILMLPVDDNDELPVVVVARPLADVLASDVRLIPVVVVSRDVAVVRGVPPDGVAVPRLAAAVAVDRRGVPFTSASAAALKASPTIAGVDGVVADGMEAGVVTPR